MCADDGARPENGGAAVRGSSPGPVLRAPSPEPSLGTLNSPYFAAALVLIKGAAAQALDVPLAATTEAVKPYDDLCGRITLNSVPSFPSKPQRTRFERLVADKVAEDAAYRVFSMPKAMAQELYTDFCDDATMSMEELEDVQILSLCDWSLSSMTLGVPVVKSTAQLGRVELTGFKHRNEKGHFEVSFKVHPAGADPVMAEAPEASRPSLAELMPSVERPAWLRCGQTIVSELLPMLGVPCGRTLDMALLVGKIWKSDTGRQNGGVSNSVMPLDEQLPWDHVPPQLSPADAAELILTHIEKGQVFARDVVSKADKEDLRRFEKKALARFAKTSQNAAAARRSPSLPQLQRASLTISTSMQRTNFQRGFGVSKRPPIYAGADNLKMGPGKYHTELVGAMLWDKDGGLSHPAQQQLTSFKSPPIVSFTVAKGIGLSQAKITGAPGPGHYTKPDLWDPHWQHCPAVGFSFGRMPPEPSESRFGGLAKGKT